MVDPILLELFVLHLLNEGGLLPETFHEGSVGAVKLLLRWIVQFYLVVRVVADTSMEVDVLGVLLIVAADVRCDR